MNRGQQYSIKKPPSQGEYMKNSFTTQSNHDSVGMSSSVNDIGVFHPHVNNQQVQPMPTNDYPFHQNYHSKGSDGGFAGSKQSMWTPDEDTTLVRLVEKIGPQKWALIADYLPNR